MHKTLFALVVATALLSTAANAQERRSAGGPGHPPRPVIAANARYPFVGTWIGTMTIRGDQPVLFEFAVEHGAYKSGRVFPDNNYVQLDNTRLNGEELSWESPNSGGGVWHYKARRITSDSIVGLVELRGITPPEGFPGKGSFTLVRRPAPQTRR